MRKQLILIFLIFCYYNQPVSRVHALPLCQLTVYHDYVIMALANKNDVWDNYFGKEGDDAPLTVYALHFGDNQRWHIVPAKQGYFFIIQKSTGKYLDVKKDASCKFKVILTAAHLEDSQKWQLIEEKNNGVLFRNKHYNVLIGFDEKKGIILNASASVKNYWLILSPAEIAQLSMERLTEYFKKYEELTREEERKRLREEMISAYKVFAMYVNKYLEPSYLEKSIDYYNAIIALAPNIEITDSKLVDCGAEALFWLAVYAVNDTQFNEAKNYYDRFIVLKNKNPQTKERLFKGQDEKRLYLTILAERLELGAVTPAATERISNIFVRKSSIKGKNKNGELVLKEYTMTDSQIQYIQAQLALSKICIELFTKGNLLLEYQTLVLENVIRGEQKSKVASVDYNRITPFPGEAIFKHLKEAGVFFLFYTFPFDKSCWGGEDDFPIIPNALYTPKMGACWFPIEMVWVGNVVHEYFHTVEILFGWFPSQDLGVKKYFPDFNFKKYNEESFDYWAWQFSVNIPEVFRKQQEQGNTTGWKIFERAANNPMMITQEQITNQLKTYESIPFESRPEIKQLIQEANVARQKNQKDKIKKIYKQLFILAPGHFEAYRADAFKAFDEKKYKKALILFKKYLTYVPDWESTLQVGKILVGKLASEKEGIQYFELAMKLADNDWDRSIVSAVAGSTFAELAQYEKAIAWFDRVIGKNDFYITLECLFGKGKVLIQSGQREQGLSCLKQAMEKGLAKSDYYQRKYQYWLNNSFY